MVTRRNLDKEAKNYGTEGVKKKRGTKKQTRYIYEVELFEEGGDMLAYLFDFGQMAQRKDMFDAVDMAASLLCVEIEKYLLKNEELPPPTFGNVPKNGGRIIAVAVDIDLQTSEEFITAKEAAQVLGVTAPRISHMFRDGLLHGYRDRGNTFITVESVNAYKAKSRKAGRPRNPK